MARTFDVADTTKYVLSSMRICLAPALPAAAVEVDPLAAVTVMLGKVGATEDVGVSELEGKVVA